MKKNLNELVLYLPLMFIVLCSLISILALIFQWGAYPTLQSLIFCFALLSMVILHDARSTIAVIHVRYREEDLSGSPSSTEEVLRREIDV